MSLYFRIFFMNISGIINNSRSDRRLLKHRSGTTLEIVSKVLLRHSNLSTTQIYLGKVSDVEAIRWIDNLHG